MVRPCGPPVGPSFLDPCLYMGISTNIHNTVSIYFDPMKFKCSNLVVCMWYWHWQ